MIGARGPPARRAVRQPTYRLEASCAAFSADQRTRPRQDASVRTDGYVQNIWDGPESEHTATPARCHYVSTTQTPPGLAAELAQAWADIQRHHPELPDVAAPETLIGELAYACGLETSLVRPLHEAVQGAPPARGVRDTSRAGRYHNRRCLAIAEKLGLDHPEEPQPSS